MEIRVGDIGRALSPMSPSGVVDVNGERLDARSNGRFIEAGSLVVVLHGDPTGYVVRKLEPGQTPPRLPDHGEPIRKADFQLNSIEVAQADRHERTATRKQLLQQWHHDRSVAVCLGPLAGLVSGVVGWSFGWSGLTDLGSVALLLGGSVAVGAFASVCLFTLAAWVTSMLGMFEGKVGYFPDLFATVAGLVGAALGFWWQYGTGDVLAIIPGVVGGATVFATVVYLLWWLARNALLSDAGD